MSEPDARPRPDDDGGPEGAEGQVVDPTQEVGRDGSTTRAGDDDAVQEAADRAATTAATGLATPTREP